MQEIIKVKNLSKRFHYPVRRPDVGWFRNLFWPEKREVVAVDNISFAVRPGERIAFIGPNGAGKSTTIKMLTGILYPSSGELDVLGLDPREERKSLAKKIGTVFGQRSQLLPNLPLRDSLEFFGVMYGLDKMRIERRIKELTDLFDLTGFIGQPVRKLSLGQRMRGEIAASLIHEPQLILLDEPTIGLDVVAKKSLRDLLLRINREAGTTIFLTSHDVGDIESLCDRTIIINQGRLIKDLPTCELARTFITEKYISLTAADTYSVFPALPDGLKYLEQSPQKVMLSLDLKMMSSQTAIQHLLDIFPAEDIDVRNADLETVIRYIYEQDATDN